MGGVSLARNSRLANTPVLCACVTGRVVKRCGQASGASRSGQEPDVSKQAYRCSLGTRTGSGVGEKSHRNPVCGVVVRAGSSSPWRLCERVGRVGPWRSMG